MKIQKNVKLAKYTTFHIGGKAKFFAEVKSVEELKKAVDFTKKKKLKIFVLGGGSNVLLPDKGLPGLVLKINIKGIKFDNNEHKNKEHVLMYAGAGETWDKVVAKTVAKNLGGIENLSLIPGTVGGAVYQNIGAYGVELKDVLDFVEVFDKKDGTLKTLSGPNCRFGYRDSIFQHSEGINYIILDTTLKLSNNPEPKINYPDLIKYFESKASTISEVRKAVIKIRRSKLVYPNPNVGTAGSFFKNPVVTISSFQFLVSRYSDIKGRDIGDDLVKLSAGQLIEKAGWKGERSGKAGVSKKHALVLVSNKGAKAKDILKLAKLIQNSVKDKFDIKLEPEVKIVTSG